MFKRQSHFGINFLTKLKTSPRFDQSVITFSPALMANTIVSIQFRITSPLNSIIFAFAKASLTGYPAGSY